MIDMYIDNSEPSENVGQIHFCVEYDFQNNTLILKILQVSNFCLMANSFSINPLLYQNIGYNQWLLVFFMFRHFKKSLTNINEESKKKKKSGNKNQKKTDARTIGRQ